MHSKGMYLGLQGTRIFVGFLRVLAVILQKACMHAIGANDIRAGEGLTWRRQQINHSYRFWCALEQPAACSCCLRVVLVAHDAVFGSARGLSRLQGTQHSKRAHQWSAKWRSWSRRQQAALGYGQLLCRRFSSWCIELVRRAHFHRALSCRSFAFYFFPPSGVFLIFFSTSVSMCVGFDGCVMEV